MKRRHLHPHHRARALATKLSVNRPDGLMLIEGDPNVVRSFMDEVMALEIMFGCDCDGLFLAIDPREREGLYTVWVYHSRGCPRLMADA